MRWYYSRKGLIIITEITLAVHPLNCGVSSHSKWTKLREGQNACPRQDGTILLCLFSCQRQAKLADKPWLASCRLQSLLLCFLQQLTMSWLWHN